MQSGDLLESKISKLSILSLAHACNDWYAVIIMILLPFLVADGTIGIGQGASLVTAFTVTSFLVQPLFGYLIDKKNNQWLYYFGTLFMALPLSLMGIVRSFPFLVLLASLAGIGNAMFHPFGSAKVSEMSSQKKGLYQAVFIALGNCGWAVTGLMLTPIIEKFGLNVTPYFILPALFSTVLILFTIPLPEPLSVEKNVTPTIQPLWLVLRPKLLNLSTIVFVTSLWSASFFGFISFLPLYIQHEKIAAATGNYFLMTMSISSAIGVIFGGYISDIIGRKVVIVLSMLAACPLYYFFLHSNSPEQYIFLALGSAFLFASFSALIVVTQEAIRQNVALAAGLVLGFANGLGGVWIGLFGIVADHKGLPFVIHALVWLPLLAGVLALGIKDREYIEDSEFAKSDKPLSAVKS